MSTRMWLTAVVCLLPTPAALPAGEPRAAEDPAAEQGTVEFRPVGDETDSPADYRMAPHKFDYRLVPRASSAGIQISRLTFPSPVTSPYPENNTVYADFYRPPGPGPFPATIILDITGGDQKLSRTIALQLASQGIAGLFVQMAYYGPRRPPAGNVKLLSTNVPRTLAAVKQTVLDLRRAAAWLGSRPDVDPKRLGILGTSLGSFVAALTAEMEPRLDRVVVILGGGGLVDAFYEHPKAAPFRRLFEFAGGDRRMLAAVIADVDPITRADRLKNRRLLMVAAKHDEIVPPKAAESLWNASGRQKIVWFDAGHYTAALYFPAAMKHVIRHLTAD